MKTLETISLYNSRDLDKSWMYILPTTEEQLKMEKLFDLAERLSSAGYEEEALELEDYILDFHKRSIDWIIKKYRAILEWIANEVVVENEVEYDDDDCQMVNVNRDIVSSIENILEKWTKKETQYKNCIRYTDLYLCRDNVLDKWFIKWTQWYGKSNIEKDNFKFGNLPARYIRARNAQEKWLEWTPIPRDISVYEYLQLYKGWFVVESIEDLILNTKNKGLPYPALIELTSSYITLEDLKELTYEDKQEIKELEELKKEYKEFKSILSYLKNEEDKEYLLNKYEHWKLSIQEAKDYINAVIFCEKMNMFFFENNPEHYFIDREYKSIKVEHCCGIEWVCSFEDKEYMKQVIKETKEAYKRVVA